MSEASTVFAFQAQAVAGAECDHKAGERCYFVAFASGETMDAACEFVADEMGALGWEEIVFKRGAPIAPIRSHADWRYVDAYQAAERGGCGLLTWKEGAQA